MIRALLNARRTLLTIAAFLAVAGLAAHALILESQPLEAQSVASGGGSGAALAPTPFLALALVGVMGCLIVGLRFLPARDR